MKLGHIYWVGVFAAALLLSGCGSIDSRIARHATAWDALSKTDQDRVKKGDVRPGDHWELVLIAYGEPDRKEASLLLNHGREIRWYYERVVHNGASESAARPSSPPVNVNYAPVQSNGETGYEQAAQLKQTARENAASREAINRDMRLNSSGRFGVEIMRLIVINDEGVVVSNSSLLFQ